jgi:hypothetical protein
MKKNGMKRIHVTCVKEMRKFCKILIGNLDSSHLKDVVVSRKITLKWIL